MGEQLFGVPLIVWGAICLSLAVLWTVMWPSAKAAHVKGVRLIVLRWFHALVWLLLALAAFAAAFNVTGAIVVASVLALLSIVVYFVFMGTLATS